MRDIKFRGMTTKGSWVYGSLVNTTQGLRNKPNQHTKTWIVTSSFGNGCWFHVKDRHYVLPSTVGQYTDLKDSRGVEIYEGDIVSYSDFISEVVFNNGCFMTKHKPKWHEGKELYRWLESDLKVIGNIHQNPELLSN